MILLLFKLTLIAYVFCALMEPEMIFSWYAKLLDKLPYWLSNPLGLCFKCFTGQVCLWGYIIFYFKSYNIIDHLFFISAGIFLSLIYNKIWAICEQ